MQPLLALDNIKVAISELESFFELKLTYCNCKEEN